MNHAIQIFRKKIFNPVDCPKIISDLESFKKERGGMMSDRGDGFARQCELSWIARDSKLEYIHKPIEDAFTEAAGFFGFTIDRIEKLQYTVYRPFNWYFSHTDCGHNEPNVLRRKLTMSINLTDPSDYVGGRLKVKTQEPKQPTKVDGEAAIFPSFLWHKANPVWFGTRKAIVAWALGEEPFK